MQGNNYEQVYGPNGPSSNTQSPQLYKYIWYIYNVYIIHTHTHTHTHTHISFKFPNWINHELKSRFPGEISTSSDRH